MTRDERIRLIDPYLDRVTNARRELQRLLSDLDAGHLPEQVFGAEEYDSSDVYALIGVAAKRLDQAADLLKDAALRRDN